MSMSRMNRRDLLAMGAAPLRQAQNAAREQPRLPPRTELVNVPEFEEAARTKLPPAVYAAVSGGDREAFDRMTLWPRVFVDSAPLNLTTELFGEAMFAPILVAPIGQQQRFHQQGELATAQGALAAKATMIVSCDSSHALEEIRAAAKATLWYQTYLDRSASDVRKDFERAAKAGCRAICLTLGGPTSAGSAERTSPPRPDWRKVDQVLRTGSTPVVMKGVMTPADAQAAVERGLGGIVVSNGGLAGQPAPMEVLASIVDTVGARVPVLVDGGFRRGTDIIKALALGAKAVLVGRPVMWGLAPYGADGVQSVLRMLQTELARTMVNVGKPTLASLDRSLVRTHRRASY
jgi:isopentenyl diphosphate isomerase/L-lactate dehydrogenase-like FMN-dependent dehydrogenase